MAPHTDAMHFGSATPVLPAPALIAITIAVVAFIVWLAVGTRDPDAFDVLKWIAAAVIGAVCIAYAASWHEVVVDAATRQVIVRTGILQYPVSALGNQVRFSDITAVIVAQKVDKESEPTSTSTSRSTRTVYRKSYTLSLSRADTSITLPDRTLVVPQHAIDLPVKQRDDPLALEAMALQLARLGGWPARRRGYALSSGYGDRPYTITSTAYDAESEIGARN